ncbi:MAG: hypothetical protein KGL39_39820 [Patescibacteria group bacterium]|nr:hypothetical protein [Patescibacteria group bacterium]
MLTEIDEISQIRWLAKPKVAIPDIVAAVAHKSGIATVQLLGERRQKHIAKQRFMLYWLCRELTGHSYPLLGRMLNRDHTTLLHGIKRFEEMRQSDMKLKQISDELLRELA